MAAMMETSEGATLVEDSPEDTMPTIDAPPAAVVHNTAPVVPTKRGAPLPTTVAEKIARATELKEEGNGHFREGRYKKALTLYTRVFAFTTGLQGMKGGGMAEWASESLGVSDEKAAEMAAGTNATDEQLAQVDELKLAVNSNMAAAHLKLEQPAKALHRAGEAINLSKDNVKALFRKGQAELQMGHLDDAKETLARAAELEPSNTGVRAEQRKLAQRFKVHRDAERARFSKAFGGGAAKRPKAPAGEDAAPPAEAAADAAATGPAEDA